MKNWSVEKSSSLYGLDFWGGKYFHVNKEGHLEIRPEGGSDSPSLDLYKMVKDFENQGVNLPLLVRFPGVIKSQMKRLNSCFEKAIKEQDYQGKYFGVFPVKVNQQRHVIEDIVESGSEYNFGLETGSKPELLIALSYMQSDRLIICNGFKDEAYVEMALLSLKAGRNIFLVVERMKELDLILKLSKRIDVRPQIGFRLKLQTQSEGLWEKSSGFTSKFGLSPSGLLKAIEKVKKEKFLDCVKLLHFHIGSQLPSIQPIKSAIKECSRFMAELFSMNCQIEYVDVGGGLAVDYDGSGSSTRNSTNYDIQEYANDIVFALDSICKEKQIPSPHIITESGRFLVAQSSLLICNVLDSYELGRKEKIKVSKKASSFLKELNDIYQSIPLVSCNESFNDLVEKKKEMKQVFIYGDVSLEEMALAEKIYWQSISLLKDKTEGIDKYEDLHVELKGLLIDTYFLNLSIFQSLPDSWALSYTFPVMPLHRLSEKPDRRARLVDLTCDSDGQISHIVDYSSWNVDSSMPVHSLKNEEPYFMGIFLTGAYQEILGDLHNLFGDTNAVHIHVRGDQDYSLEHLVEADSISEVLEYVEFNKKQILEKMQKIVEKSISQRQISRKEAGLLMEKFEENLSCSTYLK